MLSKTNLGRTKGPPMVEIRQAPGPAGCEGAVTSIPTLAARAHV